MIAHILNSRFVFRKVRRVIRMKICLIMFWVSVGASSAGAQTFTSYDVMWGVKVPMRDGVSLNATVYKPHDLKSGLPVIVDLTPYVSDTYHNRGRYFSQHGYVYAIVDCRGRGSSEGEFRPFEQEAKDGFDMVEWFARQPYCNGKVATWGGSYTGYTQWATAKEFPPHLSTIVPVAAAQPGIDYPNPKNIFTPYVISHLTYISGKTPNLNFFNDAPFWKTKYLEMYTSHLPFTSLGKLVGNESLVFRKFLDHPAYDGFWKSMNPTQDEFRKMNLPVLTITGHYDDDQLGNMSHYRNFMSSVTAEVKSRTFLVIGPWDHAGTRTPQRELGGLTFAPAGVPDMNDLHVQWYDFTMKNGPRPAFLKKNVAYYVMGAEKWKYADRLEDVPVRTITYSLSAGTSGHDVYHSGSLTTTPAPKGDQITLTYDPLSTETGIRSAYIDTDATFLKTNLLRSLAPPLDVIREGPEMAVYHIPAFSDTTEVSGFVKLKLFVSSDAPDADLSATLYEIAPGGESVYLTSDLVRLRYRESLEREKLMKPGEVSEVNFDGFNFFSRQMPPGSRLRLVVAAVNSISWEKNYCSGGVVAEESAKDARKASIVIHHNNGKVAGSFTVPFSR